MSGWGEIFVCAPPWKGDEHTLALAEIEKMETIREAMHRGMAAAKRQRLLRERDGYGGDWIGRALRGTHRSTLVLR